MKKRTFVEWGVIGAACFLAVLIFAPRVFSFFEVKQSTTFLDKIRLVNISNTSQEMTGVTNTTCNASYVKATGAGANFTTITLAEIGSGTMPGIYNLTLNSSLTDTVGELVYRLNCTNCTPYVGKVNIVANLESDTYADTHTTGVKVISNGILSPQAFNTTGNLTGNLTNVLQVGGTAWNSGAIKTTSFTAGAIDAAAIAASAITSSEAPNLDVAVSTRGTSNLTTSSAVGSVTGAVGSVTGNVGGNLIGNVGGNINGSVASVAGNIGGNVNGSVGSVAAAVNINSNQDLTDTLSNITSVKSTVESMNTTLEDVPNTSEFEARTLPSNDYFNSAADPVFLNQTTVE